MKPDGRALDIAVIGLGQAGGNLAAEFFRRGYRTLALNTAETDLLALDEGGIYPSLPPERRLYVGLDGYDGAGADPAYGMECIQQHAERIRTAVMKQASDADVVLLVSGLGGGTGSAVAELVRVLETEALPVVALMTLPTKSESGLAKVNSVRAINDVVDAPLLGWIFVDNGRIAALNPALSLVDYFPHINTQIAESLDAFNRLNARPNVTPIRSFDGEDFRRLLLSGGVLNYAHQQVPRVSSEEVLGAFRDACEVSDLMPAGFDITRMSYVGLVIEAPQDALADVPFAAFEEIAGSLKNETEGAAVYYGIYRTGPNTPITVRTFASTQALPSAVRQLLGDAKREGRILGEKVQEDLSSLELGEIQSVELFRTRARRGERVRRRPAPVSPARLDDVPREVGRARRATRIAEAETVAQALADVRPPLPRRGRPPARIRPAVTPEPTKNAIPDEVTGASAWPQTAPIQPDLVDPEPEETMPPEESPFEEPPLPKDTPPNAPLPDASTPFEAPAEPPADPSEAAETPEGADVPEPPEAAVPSSPQGAPAELPPFSANLAPYEDSSPEPPDDGPDVEAYAQMVEEYLQTESAPARKRIAQRLEEDVASPDSSVRYYAVEAMAKLGRKSFGHALLHATEDEDEAVRKIAVEALKS